MIQRHQLLQTFDGVAVGIRRGVSDMIKVMTILTEQTSDGLERKLLPGSVFMNSKRVFVTLSFNHQELIGVATNFERDGNDVKMTIEVWDSFIALDVFNEEFWKPSYCIKIVETKKAIDNKKSEIKISDVSKGELMEVTFVSTNEVFPKE
jgi:hypothetical protein